MSSDKTSRKQARVLLFAAVLVLSVVTVGAFTAAAQFSATEELNTDNTELVEGSSVDLSPDTQTVVSDELEQRDGTAVALLIVERDIGDSAFDTSQVDAATLQADSEATLGPVADTASSMEGVTVRNEFWVGNIVSVSVDLGAVDPADLAAIDGVIGVAPNAEMTHPSPVQETSDVSIDQTDNFTYGLEQINVPGFEDKYNVSGEGATVTIIDDGISNPEEGHPDLDFAIKAVAEGGNVTTGTLGAAGSHGEHTAGTATGAADPVGDVPRYGVAPNASLIKINSFQGGAAAEDTLASVEFAVEQDSDVASMSLGFPVQNAGNSVLELLMEQQMQDALAAGTVVVGSAGNEGSGAAGGPTTSPGAEFNGFSIGASNEAGGIAGFSSGAIVDRFSVDYVDVGGGTQFPDYYPRQYVKPDVSAPGVGVLSSGPLGTPVEDSAATYSLSSGTSMAAPHVAGAVALIQSATEADVPAPLIKSALAETAEKPDNDFPSLNSRDIRYGTGIINVTAATEAILDGNLTIEGEVTDSEGNPVVGATVETDTGALTSTDENGSYTLQTTSESVNVTANAFGFAPETKLVEDDTSPVDFQLADEVAVDLRDGQPTFAEFGGGFDVTVEVANLENLTLALTSESDVAPGDVTVTLDGDELPLGQPIEFNETVNGLVTLSVDLASGGDYAEGDLLGIQHTFEGVGDSLVVETGPTELTETLDPAEYEVSNLQAPSNIVTGNPIPVSFEITNVGQQTPDSYGYQFFADNGETEISLPATELNIAPGETQTVSLSVAGVGDFYGPGEVFTHGARVGVWNEGGFISPPSIDPVEDNVTTEAAFQANGTQFNVANLDAPLEADPGQSIDVTATIESVGELGDVQDVEFRFDGAAVTNQTVDLDAFTLANGLDSTTVTFQDVTLPSEADAYEHGVFTDDDNVTASIGVGVELTDATLVRSGSGTGAADTLSLFEEDLPTIFGPVEVVNAENVTKSVIAEADTLVLHDLGDSQAEVIPAVENDPTTGAVYLEQWTASNAIADRVDVVGDPDSSETAFNSAPPAEFEIEADHPIFDGVGSAGDNVTIHTEGFSDIAWFNGADGQTLASVTDQSGAGGPAVAVDPDSGSVLLSTIAVTTSTPGLGDFSSNASQILANAAEFSEPAPFEVPYFEVTDLAAPESGGTGNLIDVSATVTNDANVSGTQTVEFVFDGAVAANTTVELNASESTTVEFTDVPLPSTEGTFEHGIQTANDSQFAEIVVGDLATVTVVEFGETFGEDVLSVFEDNISADEFETQVVNADDVTDAVVENTDIFVFNNLNVTAGATSDDVRQRSDTRHVSALDVTADVSADTVELISTVESSVTTGAVYLDQSGGGSGAIVDRSTAIGDPAETFAEFDSANPTIEYVIQQNSPLFDGVGSQGDVVELYTVGFGDHSWFEGADGDTLATVQNGAGSGGPAATVDPDSGSVLLSSLGVSTFVGPADYTTEAGQILANGVELAQPPEFSGEFFDVTGLTAPAQADVGASINVSATVTNVGNETGIQTVEFVFDGSVAATVSGVELDPGNETTVEFTDVPLPSEGGVFEHGVQTANDSQFATITVGSPDVELVELDQPDELTPGEDIITEITLTNNGTAPYEGEVLHATNLNDTAPDSGTIAIPANVTAFTLEPGENVTFTDNLGTFTEINSGLDTSFGPGDEVETGYQRGQNLAAAFEPGGEATIEEIYSETITIVEEAFFEVSGLSAPGEAPAGSSINVSATVTNTGGVAATQTVEFQFGGQTVANTTVDLDANASTTVEFSPTLPEQTGNFTHGVFTEDDDQTATIDVVDETFELSDLTAPAEAASGAEINVDATVTNTGSVAGVQDVEFRFDGQTVANTTVDLNANASTTVEFSPTLPEQTGNFTHGVFTEDDNQTATIDVVEEAFLEVSDLAAPGEAVAGSSINVSATVTNTGGVAATQTVEFRFDGQTVANTTVDLNANASTTVEFSPTLPEQTGTFTHGVFTDDDNQTAEIAVVEEAFLEVSDLAAPGEAAAGSSINVSATVTNTGGVAATQTVEFVFGGQTVANTTVDLNANASTTVEFSPTLPEQTGNFTHGVFTEDDNQTAEIAVVAPGPPNVTMANLSIAGQGEDATVVAGSYDVTAEMSHTGGAGGDVPMELTIGTETLSKNVTLEADQTVTVTFENATSGLEPGIYDVSMAGSTDAVSGSLTLSVDVGGSQEPATDTTGDGNLNDIDGNSEFNIFDVQAFFVEFQSGPIQTNSALFNFDRSEDGAVNIFDVQALFIDLVDS